MNLQACLYKEMWATPPITKCNIPNFQIAACRCERCIPLTRSKSATETFLRPNHSVITKVGYLQKLTLKRQFNHFVN